MPQFDPEALRNVYERYFNPAAKEQLVDACRKRVVRWRWATGQMSPEVSFHQELHQETAGTRWLDQGGKPEIHATVHGLDAEGIILVARWPWSYSGVGGEYKYSDAMAWETYWIHAGSETTLVTFEAAEDPAQRTPSVIFQYRVEGGRLAWRRTFNSRDANEVQYEWCENRLVREVHCCSSHPRYVPGEDPWAGAEDPWFLERTYEYGADGTLDEVWEQYIEEDDQPCADLERTLRQTDENIVPVFQIYA
jgi:hypothetical protein